MHRKQKSCLSSTIPKVNEDFVPEYFIFSSEVIEGEETQEEINEKQLIDSNIFAPWVLLLYSWLFYIIFY